MSGEVDEMTKCSNPQSLSQCWTRLWVSGTWPSALIDVDVTDGEEQNRTSCSLSTSPQLFHVHKLLSLCQGRSTLARLERCLWTSQSLVAYAGDFSTVVDDNGLVSSLPVWL